MPIDELLLILNIEGDGSLALYACRGAGKGCPRNRFRKSKSKCEDCVGPLPTDMTLEQVQRRLASGEA